MIFHLPRYAALKKKAPRSETYRTDHIIADPQCRAFEMRIEKNLSEKAKKYPSAKGEGYGYSVCAVTVYYLRASRFPMSVAPPSVNLSICIISFRRTQITVTPIKVLTAPKNPTAIPRRREQLAPAATPAAAEPITPAAKTIERSDVVFSANLLYIFYASSKF